MSDIPRDDMDEYVNLRVAQILDGLNDEQKLEIVHFARPEIKKVPPRTDRVGHLVYVAVLDICADNLARHEYFYGKTQPEDLVKELKKTLGITAEVKQGPTGRPGHNVVKFEPKGKAMPPPDKSPGKK